MAKQKRKTIKYQQQQIINADKDYDVLHQETDADIVLYDNSESGLNATNAQDAIDELKTEIDGKSSDIATAPDYNDFFKENKDPKNSGTAFSKDALVGDIKDNSASDNLTSAKQVTDYVDNKVAGKINYLGTVDGVQEVLSKMANANEGDMARVTREFPLNGDIAHVGDIVIATVNKPTTVAGFKVAHTEIDTNTWTANSKTANGFVAKGEGQHVKFWGTDSDGNPGWRDIPNPFTRCGIQYNADSGEFIIAEDFQSEKILWIETIYDDPDKETDVASAWLVSEYQTGSAKTNDHYIYTDGWSIYHLYKHEFRPWECTEIRIASMEFVNNKFGTPAEGTYSVVRTNANGVVQAGGNLIEVGADTTSEPSANLVVGGIFFKPIEVSE